MPEEIVDRPAPNAEADLQGMPLLSLKHKATESIHVVIERCALQANRSRAELDRIERLDIGGPAIRMTVLEPEFAGSIERQGSFRTQEACLSRQSIRNIYQVRIALETLAVELVAAQKIPDLQGCWNEIFRMEEAAKEGRAISFYQADFAFHRALWKTSQSESLHVCLQDIMTKLTSFSSIHRTYPAPGRLMEIAVLHRQMLEMIAVGNVEAATKMMAQSMKNDQEEDEQLSGLS